MGKRDRYAPGTFCWVDLHTTDPEGAKAFDGGLFEWDVSKLEEDPPYWGIFNRGHLNGGMMPSPDGGSYWLTYFTTGDLDGDVGRIEGSGGTTMLAPTPVPPDDRIAVFADPQGAVFALFEGRTDK